MIAAAARPRLDVKGAESPVELVEMHVKVEASFALAVTVEAGPVVVLPPKGILER